jgi:peptidylprolyl isomerase
MKKALPLFILLSLAAGAGWRWQSRQAQAAFAVAWQQAQFRSLQMDQPSVREALDQQRQLTASVPATFQPDLDLAVNTEWQIWQKQFEKGETDRQARLSWQGQTETSLKQTIREALRSQAWLEQLLPKQAQPINDAQALAWFSDHAEQLRLPARFRVCHLFLSRHDPTRPNRSAEIQALHEQLNHGKASFAELAAQHSEDSRSKSRGGDLGWVSATRMPADLMQAVNALEVGETSSPIETQLGWHLLRVSARQDSRLPYFAEVRDEIIATLDQQRRETALASGNP